ncbi:MAG: enoyl-CoA hydratase/isomerase family protein [Dehalococcoidia bacterium]|nr:enoyl-CoA hydratase/isomerase family protein [Dehalococcoidia bacterium]
MELETMKYETDGDLSRLALDRPEVLNAINYQGTLDLYQAAQAIHDDARARAVLIRGNGRAFCTGIDLKELSAEETPQDYFYQWDQALRLLERSDKLIVCAIQGYAIGGGLQLPLACDIRIATEGAVLGLPAAKEGFIPGLSTYRLPRYIGLGRAKRMAISGENVNGVEALRIGLVDYIVKSSEFEREVEAVTHRFLALSSEGARQTKLMLSAYQDLPHGQFFEEYLHRQSIAIAAPDHDEAMTAYREKREPAYKSR